ncbi:MAG: VacJ family lipoprotein [Pseudomonadota bacterium]
MTVNRRPCPEMNGLNAYGRRTSTNPVRVATTILLTALLFGCTTPGDTLKAGDPLEPVNRGIYRFNTATDRILLKPLARGYRWVLPDPVERSVTNVLNNLNEPRNLANSLLQGKPRDAASTTGRLLINSTLGVAGIWDPAKRMGLTRQQEDFGQTLAVWGIPSGPFFMMPFFGPSTLRDGSALLVDQLADGRNLINDAGTRDRIFGLQLVSTRAALLPLDSQLASALDPYILLRETILQRRHFVIYDGDPPVEDDDFDTGDDDF